MTQQTVQERKEELEQMAFQMAASLETQVRQWIDLAVISVNKGEASEIMKEVTDILKGNMLEEALRQTRVEKHAHGEDYYEWNRQMAALVLGVPHKSVNSMIKAYGCIEPEKPEEPDAQQTIPFPPGGQSGRKDIYD